MSQLTQSVVGEKHQHQNLTQKPKYPNKRTNIASLKQPQPEQARVHYILCKCSLLIQIETSKNIYIYTHVFVCTCVRAHGNLWPFTLYMNRNFMYPLQKCFLGNACAKLIVMTVRCYSTNHPTTLRKLLPNFTHTKSSHISLNHPQITHPRFHFALASITITHFSSFSSLTRKFISHCRYSFITLTCSFHIQIHLDSRSLIVPKLKRKLSIFKHWTRQTLYKHLQLHNLLPLHSLSDLTARRLPYSRAVGSRLYQYFRIFILTNETRLPKNHYIVH